MTKQTKQVYETPTTESLELRFEGAILDGSLRFGASGQNPDFFSSSIDDQGDY